MTVREVVAALLKEDQDMRCVVDLHSEYSEVTFIKRITGFENGGYVSRIYRPNDSTRGHGWVYLSPHEED